MYPIFPWKWFDESKAKREKQKHLKRGDFVYKKWWRHYFKRFAICNSKKIWNFNRTKFEMISRGGSMAAATSKMERFVIIVNSFQPLTIITKRSILDVAAALDLPLITFYKFWKLFWYLDVLVFHTSLWYLNMFYDDLKGVLIQILSKASSSHEHRYFLRYPSRHLPAQS